MKARMYQRRHLRSPNAAPKPYDFLKLPITLDVSPIVEEIGATPLPWITSLWKWHRGTSFCVLRAGPEGVLSGDELLTGKGIDAPILDRLPKIRALLDGKHQSGLLPFRAPLAWIGQSPPHSTIRMHVDNTQHWDEHHRIHIPLVTSSGARLGVGRGFVHMERGSVWAFNNSRPHGALNDGPERLHLVLDLPSIPEVETFLAHGERVTGEPDAEALARLSVDPLGDGGVGERPEVLSRMLMQ